MKRLTILGATGSIGTQTLDVVRHNRQDFEVVAMTASVNVQKMAELILEFSPSYAVMKNEEKAKELEALIPHSDCTVLYGMEGFVEVSTLPQTEVVVAAMVGMIGLRPVMEAIRAGKDIALANKETLVTAGHIIMPLAKEYGVSLLPVDSEHSAIFQCLNGEKKSQIETIYLTASGGPFRHYTKEQLEDVTVEQALAHPSWFMGPKITIDSATMINKGLEIIEAKWLFDVDLDQIHVLVQPQPERQIVAELIREKALRLLSDEIPHGIAVAIDQMKNRPGKRNLVDIDATIICERSSHKGIIIGKQGSMLKRIGTDARREIEEFLQAKVNLKLWVKVKKDWRDSDFLLKNFGYKDMD